MQGRSGTQFEYDITRSGAMTADLVTFELADEQLSVTCVRPARPDLDAACATMLASLVPHDK